MAFGSAESVRNLCDAFFCNICRRHQLARLRRVACTRLSIPRYIYMYLCELYFGSRTP